MESSGVLMPTDVSVITTYRCQMRCKMCNIWKYPSDPAREITPKDLEKLPVMKFANVTGGEPFQRKDLEDIIAVLFTKVPRVVISTSGWHYDRIIKLAEKYPKIGIRVSIEGLSVRNDDLRGKNGGYDNGLKVLLKLRSMGLKDIGFGITVSNHNSEDMLWLYKLSRELKMEFATATFHNSFYFHKDDNEVTNKELVVSNFQELVYNLLKENNPKSWARAFFNLGVINYIRNGKRMLPCEAGLTNFFVEPYGDVYPCNGLEDRIWKESMGNLRDFNTFEELWNSEQAVKVRNMVKVCPKNCWMVGTAAPVMKKYFRHPAQWIVENKIKSFLGKEVCFEKIPYYNVGQSPLQGDLDFTRLKPFTDSKGVKPDPSLPLVEE
ncbi:MAG: radical SAM protein [Bacteroidales bacterium]|nr:radical SAM protein [Bacteroidales bacterium]